MEYEHNNIITSSVATKSGRCNNSILNFIILPSTFWAELNENKSDADVIEQLSIYSILLHPTTYANELYPFMRKCMLNGRETILKFMCQKSEMISYQHELTKELWALLKR